MESFREENHCYFFTNKEGSPYSASNFTMKNPYLIKSSNPKRIIEAVNKYGQTTTFEISSNDFASLQKFKGIVEGRGNFIWHGANRELSHVKSVLYLEAKEAEEISYLGFNGSGNIYAFSNGIFNSKSEFIKCDINGFCQDGATCFFIPFASEINISNNDTYENYRNFRHVQRDDVNFESWSALFYKVYGDNACLTLPYVFAAAFRDIVLNFLSFFPHHFSFGEPQSGKSAFTESLQYLWGLKQTPINLEAGSTAIGSFRKMEQFSNAAIAFNEYKNNIDPKLIGIFKASYDGQGRETGVKSNDSQTKSTKIRSALLIAGQDLPTNDPAVFSRIILMKFKKPNTYTNEEKQLFDELGEIQKGILTTVLAEILTHREHFHKNFKSVYNSELKKLKNHFSGKYDGDRALLNYAILPASLKIMQDKLKLPFTYDEFYSKLTINIEEYLDLLRTSTDVSKFWDAIQYLYSAGRITIDKHFAFKVTPEQREVVAINWKLIYPEYRLYMIQQRSVPLGDKTLLIYLKNMAYFVDYKKARFQNDTNWSYFFYYNKLGINLK